MSACLDVDEARTFFLKQKGMVEDDDDDDEKKGKKKKKKKKKKKEKNLFLSVLDEIEEEDSIDDGNPKTKFAKNAGVSNLLIGFFHFYHHTFNYEGSVVCVRTGQIMNKNDYRPGERGVRIYDIHQ